MSGKIYLIDEDEMLRPLQEAEYDSENLLQRLLAKHPDLLAGEQIDAGDPRRWLLVKREYGVPDAEDGASRWALDHLFLDQDGVPTLVEVKRSSDTRARRRVAGQMLDYAANAVRYWPIEEMRQRFRATCEAHGENPAARLAHLLETDPDDEATPDDFWQDVKTNLKAGRIRMLFVADRIPTELQRIVEFLNEQMDPAEVLAVEVRQYTGTDSGELKTLVPTVIGQTAEAQQRKGGGSKGTAWNKQNFFQALQERNDETTAQTARDLHDWVNSFDDGSVDWGRGDDQAGFIARFSTESQTHGLFKVGVNANIKVYTFHFDNAVFASEPMWNVLRRKLSTLNVEFPEHARLNRQPNLPLADLNESDRFEQFKDTFGWVIEQYRTAETTNT